MAKTINISYMGEEAIFGYKPIDRGALYGKRKRVPFDAEGNECAKASLLDDGSLLIRSGMTAQGYFDAQGNWVPQGELETEYLLVRAGEPVRQCRQLRPSMEH